MIPDCGEVGKSGDQKDHLMCSARLARDTRILWGMTQKVSEVGIVRETNLYPTSPPHYFPT